MNTKSLKRPSSGTANKESFSSAGRGSTDSKVELPKLENANSTKTLSHNASPKHNINGSPIAQQNGSPNTQNGASPNAHNGSASPSAFSHVQANAQAKGDQSKGNNSPAAAINQITLHSTTHVKSMTTTPIAAQSNPQATFVANVNMNTSNTEEPNEANRKKLVTGDSAASSTKKLPPSNKAPNRKKAGSKAVESKTSADDASEHRDSVSQLSPGAKTPGNKTPGNKTPGNKTPGEKTPGEKTPGNKTPTNKSKDGKSQKPIEARTVDIGITSQETKSTTDDKTPEVTARPATTKERKPRGSILATGANTITVSAALINPNPNPNNISKTYSDGDSALSDVAKKPVAMLSKKHSKDTLKAKKDSADVKGKSGFANQAVYQQHINLLSESMAKGEEDHHEISNNEDHFLQNYVDDNKNGEKKPSHADNGHHIEDPHLHEDEDEEDILNQMPTIDSRENLGTNDDIHELEQELEKRSKNRKRGDSDSPETRKTFDADYLNPITLTTRRRDLSPKFIHHFACMRAYAYGSFLESERMNESRGLFSSLQTPPSGVERVYSPPKTMNMTSHDSNVTKKHFYYDILREIEIMQLNENINEADEMIMKADKSDQDAHALMESRLGRKFANGLFYLMKQYSEDSGSNSNRMSCNTLVRMLRDFGILNEKVNKERVGIIYSKRCKRSLVDYGSFIDILYKISKFFNKGVQDKYVKFQLFLDEHLISLIPDVLGRKPYKPSFSKIQVFGNEYTLENQALRLFEGYDDLLKHLFILHSTYDFKYHDRAFISLRSYRKLFIEFSIVPLLVHLKEAFELFRRLQIGEYSIIDFRGFVKIIAIIAHIGFSKPQYKNKYDTYPKKVAKLFEFLQEANSRLSDELVLKCLTQVKEEKHVIA